MRNGFLGSIAALAAGAGLAWGQTTSMPPSAQPVGSATIGESAILPVSGGAGPILAPPLPFGGATYDPQITGPIYPTPANFLPVDPSTLPSAAAPTSGPEAPHWWINADYLLWFVKSQPINYPLLTSGSSLRVPGGQFGTRPGALNMPATSILSGADDIAYNIFSGFRVMGGYYWDDARRHGFELGGFLLQSRRKADMFMADAAGSPVIARPFVNSNNFNQDALIITAPGVAGSGGGLVATTSQTFGAEGNYLVNLYRGCPADHSALSVTALAGLRWVELKEDLSVTTISNLFVNTPQPPVFGAFPPELGLNVLPGQVRFLTIFDSVKTINDFYGGQLGLQTSYRSGRFYVNGTYKVAAGVMHSRIDVQGGTSFTRGTPPITGTFPGGVFSTPELIGRYNRDRFSVVPEVNLNLGYQLTPCFTAFIGYNFLYMTGVIRPGETINPLVSPFTIPANPNFGLGVPGPNVRTLFRTSDFWAQGVNFGLMFTY